MSHPKLLYIVLFSKTLTLCLGLLLSYAYGNTNTIRDSAEYSRTPAFPGAQGGGMYTTGGRGGKVIRVSNLHDRGPGSLREAIQSQGTRTIVFDVSGTIELESRLTVEHGNLTIAGQTAPGDGICIKGHEFRINASNIIIRYMRFRPGDIAGKEYDAITGMRNQFIIIDHCSFSWSTDETVSLYDNANFTLQNCIISESLNNSVHSKGAHGYGGIWGGKNASFLYNIIAHHNSRNPRLQGTRYQKEEDMEKAEIINNIIYNWGDKAIYGGENGRYNIQKNIFIPGPATRLSKHKEILEPYLPYGNFYLEGNLLMVSGSLQPAGWDHVLIPHHELTNIQSLTPFAFAQEASIMKGSKAYDHILQHAGASLSRDAVDARIIEEIRHQGATYGKQGIIDSQNEVGGWPQLQSHAPLPDTDGDGIPDCWELLLGLDPHDPTDGNQMTLQAGYTNLEVYLNAIVLTP